MALITCKNCGKEVSDRAKICPACGTVLIEDVVEEAKPLICEECGSEIPEGSEACPNCGCPVQIEEKAIEEPTVAQKVEVTNLPKMNKQTKKRIIVAAVVAALLIVGTIIGAIIIKGAKAAKEAQLAKESAANYDSNLSLLSFYMLTGGAKAETAGNLIKKVWYNAIYEERDYETDKYTRPNGYFVDDFNTALGNLFSDNSFKQTIKEIEDNQDLVASLMKEMKNPPDGYDEAYQALKECYDEYLNFTNLVTNPTGSLTTFSSNFNNADSSFMNKYNKLKLYLD